MPASEWRLFSAPQEIHHEIPSWCFITAHCAWLECKHFSTLGFARWQILGQSFTSGQFWALLKTGWGQWQQHTVPLECPSSSFAASTESSSLIHGVIYWSHFLQHVPDLISPVEHQRFSNTACNVLPTDTKKVIKHEVLNTKDKERSWEKTNVKNANGLCCFVSTLTALKGHSVLSVTRSLQVQAKLCQVPEVRKSFKVWSLAKSTNKRFQRCLDLFMWALPESQRWGGRDPTPDVREGSEGAHPALPAPRNSSWTRNTLATPARIFCTGLSLQQIKESPEPLTLPISAVQDTTMVLGTVVDKRTSEVMLIGRLGRFGSTPFLVGGR